MVCIWSTYFLNTIDGNIPYIIFLISCSNLKNENLIKCFSKSYTYRTKKNKIPNYLKEKKVELFNLLTTQRIFLHEKI
jgi:hypothetical protein